MENNRLEMSGAASFRWPEPLVIDVINEHYRDGIDPIDRGLIARLQQRALQALFEDDVARSTSARLELITFCAARGISPERIAMADRAVFKELICLAGIQFRTSARRRAAISSRLHVALGRLALSAAPAAKPAYVPLRPRRLLPAHAA